MESRSPGRAKIIAGFLAIYIIWGSTYLAIRFAIETLPPFLMAAARWIIPGLALVAWAFARDHAPRPTAAQMRSTAIVGVLLLVGGNGLVSWAEQWVASGLTALLIASVPLWIAALEWAIARARAAPHELSRRRAFGLLIGFAGVGALVGAARSTHGTAAPAAVSHTFGVVALLCAAFLWAVGSLVARHAPLPPSAVLGTGLEMLWGGAALLLLGSVTGEWSRVDLAHVSMRSGLALAYLMLFGSILGFSAYVWLLRVSTPAKVATYAYVNPVVAVLLGWLFAGEPLTARLLIAATIVVGSVFMITSAKS